MSKALPKGGSALCHVQGYERPASGRVSPPTIVTEAEMLNLDQVGDSERVGEIAERLATMLGLLQAQFKVAPDVIAMVVGAVLVEDGGRDALDALALGSQAGLVRYEMGRKAERRERKITRGTSGQPGGGGR